MQPRTTRPKETETTKENKSSGSQQSPTAPSGVEHLTSDLSLSPPSFYPHLTRTITTVTTKTTQIRPHTHEQPTHERLVHLYLVAQFCVSRTHATTTPTKKEPRVNKERRTGSFPTLLFSSASLTMSLKESAISLKNDPPFGASP